MKTTLSRIRTELLVVLCVVVLAAPVAAQTTHSVSGNWTARNVRPASGASFSVFLELNQIGDSVSGKLSTESNRGERGIDVLLYGHVVSDSVFLVDAQRIPWIAAKISESFLTGRIAMSRGRGRGVQDLKTLGPSARSVRFQRSAR